VILKWLFDKLMVFLDCRNALDCRRTWSRPSFCTCFQVETFGAFCGLINLCLWPIRCLCYTRRKRFFFCYIRCCLFIIFLKTF